VPALASGVEGSGAKQTAMKVIQVKVKPNGREGLLEELIDGTYFANLKSAPVDGKANAELVALVAKHFKVRKAAVAIKSGASARMKLVAVDLP
jgi:uncharacterized protein YggU (UPF0235/DUF167 family)